MEKKNPRGSIDELALVKAAAWAWYQHGSGSEGRPIREFDLSRTENAPKPSRYKIEAMKDYYYAHEESDEKLSPQFSPLSSIAEHSDISLLDTYEIESISKQLNLYIEWSRAEFYRSFQQKGHRKVASLPQSGTSEKKSKNKEKSSKGLNLLMGCGSRHDDVVQGRSFRVADSRWPEKHATVVKRPGSRRRQGIHA